MECIVPKYMGKESCIESYSLKVLSGRDLVRPVDDEVFRPYLLVQLFAEDSTIPREHFTVDRVLEPNEHDAAFDWVIADHWEPVKDVPNVSRLARIGLKLYDYGIDANSSTNDRLIGQASTSEAATANLLKELSPGEHIISLDLTSPEGEAVGTVDLRLRIFKNNLNI